MKYRTFENGGTVEGRVSINGLIMTGPLKLQKDPVELNEAANKSYVDNIAENIDASKIVSGLIAVERMPSLSGDFNSVAGTGVITLKNSGVVPGSYTKVTVNNSGLVTNGSNLIEADIPGFGWERITSGKPTTLDGYGITNAVNAINGTVNGNIVLAADPVDTTDLVTKRYVDDLISNRIGFSIGDIISNEGPVVPTGFLRCNGGDISKTTYAGLYAVVGEQFSENQTYGSGKPWQQQYMFNETLTGDITGWTTGTAMPAVHAQSSVIVTKNRVYMLGGNNTTTALATVYTAPINSDGTLGTWTTATSLPGPLQGSQAIVTKNRVYLLGGHNGSATVATVYTAPINSDGTLGAWVTATSLPAARQVAQAIVTKDRVYFIGGINSSVTYVTSVYTAPINADGTLGAWTTGPSLPDGLGWSQAIVTKQRVYLLGGWNENGGEQATNNIYTAAFDSNGVLGAWSLSNYLLAPNSQSCAIASKNFVYLIGGYNGTTAVGPVRRAPINADGTIGAFVNGTAMPAGFGQGKVFLTNGRIYLLGGWNGTNYLNTVYTAPIDADYRDYSSFYDGSYLLTPNNNFRLPDYTSEQYTNGEFIIKF